MRISREDRQTHVELWRGSGLSRAEYCRRSGLAYHQLTSWLREAERRDDAVRGEDFVLIDGRTPASGKALVAGVLVVELGNGVRAQVPSGSDARWVAQVLAQVAQGVMRC